jgi:anti-anti-sigma regulatory factor
MLLITDMRETEGTCRMELQGRLIGPWVDELRRVAGEAPPRCGRVVLDLSALSFIDGCGVALLRELASNGISLDGVTPYIAAMLEGNRGG